MVSDELSDNLDCLSDETTIRRTKYTVFHTLHQENDSKNNNKTTFCFLVLYNVVSLHYCNTVYDKAFGFYTWYKYKDYDKHVVIENHGCGDFICTPDNNTLYNIMSKYSFNGFPLELRNNICKIVQENLKRTKNEDELYDVVKETLEPNYTEEFNKRSADIKMIIEIILSWATQSLWSKPLTIGTKIKLKRVGTTRM